METGEKPVSFLYNEPMTKVIVFDVDDTLLDFTACSKIAVKTACEKSHVPYSDVLYDTFLQCNDVFWSQIERGELTLAQLWKIRWKTIFSQIGIDADGSSFEVLFHSSLDETHETVPAVSDVLAALSKSYLLFAASNGRQHQQEHRLHLAGLDGYFSGIITSEKAGVNKPDARFFEALYDMILSADPSVSKSDVLMVGDSLRSDIQGAQSFGFKTWYVKEKPIDGLLTLAD